MTGCVVVVVILFVFLLMTVDDFNIGKRVGVTVVYFCIRSVLKAEVDWPTSLAIR